MTQQQESAEDLVDAFEMFEEWEDRYRFLIDMGGKLPPMDASEKTDENRVHGCQSSVWLTAHPQQSNGECVIDFAADSDSSIVRGLIAILRSVYAGQKPDDILAFDINALFTRLGLDQHLSIGRRNGLAGMVKRIRELAAQNQN
jgi:sulfur transfer protein SufE